MDDIGKERKRLRDEPGLFNYTLSGFKLGPELLSVVKRNRVESSNEPGLSSPEVLLQEDLLNILDDSDGIADRDPTIHGLDSVIKSFEKEILVPEEGLKIESDSTVPPTELGYLLEASDDELGLPPSFGSSEDESRDEVYELPATSSGAFGFADSLPFDDDMRNYGSLEYGICDQPELGSGLNGNYSEFGALGGLFDNGYVSDGGDVSEFLWHPETLPAV